MSPLILRKNRPQIMVVVLSNACVSLIGLALRPMHFLQFTYLNIFRFKSIGLALASWLFFTPLNAGFLAAHLSKMAPLLRSFTTYFSVLLA